MLKAGSNWHGTLIPAVLLALGACAGGINSWESEKTSLSTDAGESVPEPSGDFYLGKPRDDVERYFALCRDSERRQFFVTEAKRPEFAEQVPEIPPGHLAIGTMWIDVAPMHMKSLSETRFEHVDLRDFAPEEPNVVELEFRPDGIQVGRLLFG